MTKSKQKSKTDTSELKHGDEPFTPCGVDLLAEPDRVAGEPRPVIEFMPKDGGNGWAVRLTLTEAADLVSGLTAFILKHGRSA